MLCLLDCFDDILIEPFMPNGTIIAFDISILLRLARLDMLDRDVAALGPFQKLVTCSIPDVCIDERRLPLFIARATLRGLIAVLEARATGDAAR